ncbi:sarcosine oxidase subunit delta [Paraburkholderia sp. BL6665CI2N2]|uniref:Sarcosine oxidase subunit delta n=1 Tax=Paraburkholderia steynii TaxID=1245441 RepID=A0A4R0XFZ5_9BURK|nr:sarcosine oxidase subunit delta [Paraburkholderia sp. BL6665CI2N2]TCG08122.1 hypothetical protein BZM27_14575 [Paraburkholderia steynii]TDY15613.1 sarcosine oxidase subunit delta [Paraburkholderia sp. BL6665CI2N2]
MLRIPCPYCGTTRDEEEFTFGGPFDRTRPGDPQQLSDEDWADYLFTRDNVRGPAPERWRHTFGCRRWFGIERDTASHKITRVLPIARASAQDTTLQGGIHEAA